MAQVLVNKPIHPAALSRLEENANVSAPFSASREELLHMLPETDAIILCAGFTMDAEAMEKSPRLCVIGRHGVGLDNVDVSAASERGIPVVYTPYGPTESTAEHAFLLMLATARRLPQLDRAVRNGEFGIRNETRAMGRELQGKKLGIVGFGRIGQRVAEMCRAALRMPVYVFDPYVDPGTITEWGAVPIEDLVELAGMVDLLSVHTPSTPQTHHLIDQQVLQAMSPDAILINASRGAVVNEAALISALEEGQIYGAGIDVYDPEPPAPDHPLFCSERVVLTPHVASFTEEGRRLMGFTVVQDVLKVLDGQTPQYLANPQVWEQRRHRTIQ